ncbi:hypothetical protein HN803_04860 [candidate division WWE3 bacterium]|jgi:hypothetical protein|nr:hypothetical protein [candidate division WWE3 bacterium]
MNIYKVAYNPPLSYKAKKAIRESISPSDGTESIYCIDMAMDALEKNDSDYRVLDKIDTSYIEIT